MVACKSLVLVVALACAGCRDPAKESPVSYQPMAECFRAPPVVQSLGGEKRSTVLPRIAGEKLEILGLIGSWWPGQGKSSKTPTRYFIADARDNSFIGEAEIERRLREGTPDQPVPGSSITRLEQQAVFLDMDLVLPDFAQGRQPTAPEIVAARDRLRTEYPRTMAKEHVIVYRRLSPAWFAFLDGDPKFLDAKAP